MRSQDAAAGWSAYGPAHLPDGGAPDGAGELRPELADVGRLVRRGVRAVVGAARAADRTSLGGLLATHLGPERASLETVGETWPPYEHVNVQAALDAWLTEPGRSAELVGIAGHQHAMFGLADLLADDGDHQNPFGLRPANPTRTNVAAGPDGEVRACVRCGIWLVAEGDARTAVLLRGPEPHMGPPSTDVQIVSTRPGAAARTAAELRALALEHNVFRGRVLSFGQDVFGHGQSLLTFHRRPELREDQLVLDQRTLDQVHRQVVDVARHKERLLDAGQHLKRGLLLYGPPGVGKTHTVRYLMSHLSGTTVVQVTGNAMHLIAEACSIARSLQPAMVVVEDVDLIAEDRGMHPGQHPLLFQLLNEMDGLAEDADVVFVLTTNRADLLEPALAARPGRVDQAVALELPDAAARRALFELYRGGLAVDTARLEDVLARTEGVTASFLKELLRRAALLAAARTSAEDELSVSAGDLDAALEELLDTRNAMTRTLLGGAGDAVSGRPAPAAVPWPPRPGRAP